MLKKRSQSRLTADTDRKRSSTPPPPVPYLDMLASYTSSSFSTSRSTFHSSSASVPPSRFGGKAKGKHRANNVPPQPPPKDPREPELTLDTNLAEMDGIVDMTPRPSSSTDPLSNSPVHGSFESSRHSASYNWGDSFLTITPSPANTVFSNPFPSPASSVMTQRAPRPIHNSLSDKISPMSQSPPLALPITTPTDPLDEISASWEAPESWAVERDGEDPVEPDYSSSEDSVSGRPMSIGPHGTMNCSKKSKHRTSARARAPTKASKQPSSHTSFKVRIYRANNTYHVASIGLNVTVADLTPVLNMKLLLEKDMETHRLYLKERGRGTSLI